MVKTWALPWRNKLIVGTSSFSLPYLLTHHIPCSLPLILTLLDCSSSLPARDGCSLVSHLPPRSPPAQVRSTAEWMAPRTHLRVLEHKKLLLLTQAQEMCQATCRSH